MTSDTARYCIRNYELLHVEFLFAGHDTFVLKEMKMMFLIQILVNLDP